MVLGDPERDEIFVPQSCVIFKSYSGNRILPPRLFETGDDVTDYPSTIQDGDALSINCYL